VSDFFPEPIDIWTDFKGKNYLAKMYEKPAAQAFNFQLLATASKAHNLSFSNDINVIERSLFSQRKVFIPLLHEKKYLSEDQVNLLNY